MRKIKYIILALLFLAVNPFIAIANADWSTFQHDPQHTGFSSEETTLTSPLTQLFAVAPDGPSSSISDMVVSGNTIFAKVSSGKLYAIDGTSGTTIWSVQTQTGGGYLAVANNVVYAGNTCPTSCPLEAFNATNGQALWTSSNYTNGMYGIGIDTTANILIFGIGGHNIVALNATDGTPVWGQHVNDSVFGAPAVANGIVYVGVYQTAPTLYAFNSSTGAQLWTASNLCGPGSPTVVNNVVYMGDSCSDRIHAFDATNGSQIWNSVSMGYSERPEGFAFAYNNIYTESDSGRISAVNSANGHEVWFYNNAPVNGASITVIVANNIVYAASSGNKISLLNAQTGALLSQLSTSGTVYRLAISNHTLYATTSDGKIYAFFNPPPAGIVVDPATDNVHVGTPFTVNVKVNGGATPFNAAQSTVALSSNLSIISVNNPSSNACDFNYTKSPTTSDPSFAGAIFGSSSTGCTAYTMTLMPNSVGNGTITFNNASIKAYSDSSEILTAVQNGSYTINTTVPSPTPQGTTLVTVDDSVQGTGLNQWNYVGSGWSHCTDNSNPACNPNLYNNSVSWNNTSSDTATITFNGRQIIVYGLVDPNHGSGAVSIDGGPETTVSFNAATRQGNVKLWTSPLLSLGQHTLTIRVASSYIALDRADIIQNSPSNIAVTNPYFVTYGSTFTITGTRDSSITHVFVNGSESGVTYPTSTTWQAVVNVVLGNNNFTIYGKDDNNNQTASIPVTVNRHESGDINGDGVVDLTDASLFAVDYGKTDATTFTYPLSDMNNDGRVDLQDFSILAKSEQ